MGRCALAGMPGYLHVVLRVSVRMTSAGLCENGGLYVRVAGIKLLKGRKYEKKMELSS